MRLGRTAAILWGLMSLAAVAQGPTGGLAGSVVDRWENAVPQARLTLTNPQGGAALTADSARNGGYIFSQLAPGTYNLSVSAGGFKPYTRNGVEIIGGGGPSQLDVRMDLEKDDFTSDLKNLESRAAAKPDDYVAHFNLGRAYLAKGDIEKAVREIQQTVKSQPDYVPARVILGQLAIHTGAPAFALQVAEQMTLSKPGSGFAAMLAADAYRRLGQLDEAANTLQNFLKTSPNDSEVLTESGYVDLQMKQAANAEKAFNRAYRMDPSNVRALHGLAEVQLLIQEPEKAVQLVAAEVEKNPQRGDLRKELAEIELRAGQVDKAIIDLRSILEKSQDPPKEQAAVYESLGAAYQNKRDFPHAIENLKKASELTPDNAAYVTSLAGAYDSAGKSQEALASYRQAIKLDPGNAVAMNNAAFLMAKTGGDVDEALRLVQLARRQYPDSDDILDTLGWIYLKKDMVDSAGQIFQDLIEKAGTNATYHYHYAMVLAKKGDKAEALKELDLALKNHPPTGEEEEIKELIKKLS